MDYSYDLVVGQQIRAAREVCGMTQEQLAARLQTSGCDVTRSAVAKMEVGQRHIYAVELRALRDILNVSYEMLLP
ncbi:MAG: helix-turn-helix transcriptional regulator [Clostridiales bacterium]|nr:helix-turn-helix transcriptional regulator [Clostridiales bacterium]